MSFNTGYSPGRLPQGMFGMSGQGAIGGPRGVGAGALRIFLEFVSTYRPGAAAALKQELDTVNALLSKNVAEQEKNQLKLNRMRETAQRTSKFATGSEILGGVGAIGGAASFKEYRTQMMAAYQLADAASKKQIRTEYASKINSIVGLTKRQQTALIAELSLRDRIYALERRQMGLRNQGLGQQQKMNALARAYLQMQRVTATVGPRLVGLATGAIGGIFGGMVVGAGFQAIEAGLEAVGGAIQDIIDPTRKARDLATELGKAISEIGKKDNIDTLAATEQFMKDLGLSLKDNALKGLLNSAAAAEDFTTAAAELNKVMQVQLGGGAAEASQDMQALAKTLEEIDKKEDKLVTTTQRVMVAGQMGGMATQELTDKIHYQDAAWNMVQAALAAAIQKYKDLAAAEQAAADAAVMLAIQQSAVASAIASAVSIQSAPYRAILDQPFEASAKTKGLEAQIEKLQSAGGGGGKGAQYAEERALILLRQRLALMGKAIDIDKYEGKFRLEAINAKIKALQEEESAQSRVNDLLELQYKMSQKITRQSGETIIDFLQRRAKEERELQQERAKLARQGQIDELEKEKDKTQAVVDLQENAEAARSAAASSGTSKRIKLLQKELEASQKADRDTYESTQDRNKLIIKGFEDRAAEAAAITTQSALDEIEIGIRAAKTLEDRMAVSGKIAALVRAKGFYQAMLEADLVPDYIVGPMIARINGLLAKYSNAFEHMPAPRIGRTAFQKGGIFGLNNASSPFGQNVRFGEAGQEIGVVLSNKVTNALRENRGGGVNIEQMIINRSPDDLRDRYAFRRESEEAFQRSVS